MTTELSSRYDPQAVEDKWYQHWLDHDLFRAEAGSEKPTFTMVIPPPNITGSLHMGHALNNTMQDTLARWHRMRGFETLWLPGTDHAGIATQHVVEKELNAEGKSRHEIGREAFTERVWEWKERYGNTIINQLKRLGASCDWSRQRFTLDEGCSRAVREVFVDLYNRGLIYQGDYITNWCPVCGTALSDLEVEHEASEAKLYHIRYPVGSGRGHIMVATTRPETMLGDTAIAVHPDDVRYRDLVGQTVILPVIGRELPVVADEFVDPSFGTGAVKVTPAHDPNDFELGRRHHLESVTVIGRDGKMTDAAGPFAGQDRFQCRRELLERLEAEGLLDSTEPHAYSLGHCYRCDTVVEPLVSRQWFVKMQPLAEPAIEVVKQGWVKFVPERFTRTYMEWLENIRDWCISRQIWWGHRIPVWYCNCGYQTVTVTDPDKCEQCGSGEIRQDEDVLDTWFSSALWPFSTLGWPDRTGDLQYFFPTDTLITAHDIIFFWVARMIFMSLEFMNEIPFSEVMIHGVVRDADGQRMSKSRGTGIDPLEAIDRYGADALRLCLLTGAGPGGDQRFRWERIDGSRNFCNKLWNAARFALMHPGTDRQVPDSDASKLHLADRWILSRLEQTRSRVDDLLSRRELGEAADVLYSFVWDEFCDWYLELVKPRLYERLDPDSAGTARAVMTAVLDQSLRMLHPFIPFITEELWQAVTGDRISISVADWPNSRPELVDEAAERDMSRLMDIVRAIRNLRAEVKVPPSAGSPVVMNLSGEAGALAEAEAEYIKALSGADPLTVQQEGAERPRQALAEVIEGGEVFLPLAGLVDLDRERERLGRELGEARAEAESLERRLSDQRFRERAPSEVVAQQEERLQAARTKIERLERRIRELSS